jgi:hypothetical protein
MLVVLAILYLFWKLAPVQFSHLLLLISPFHTGMPPISGTVVDEMTGKPLAGMDVCLVVTVIDNFVGHTTKVMRSATTRTDASGMFSFPRWDDMLDLSEKAGPYGIAVTDPAARWSEKCGSEIYLLGGGTDVVKREVELGRQHLGSPENKRLPYFPAAVVGNPSFPSPLVYFGDGTLSWLPKPAVVQKMGDLKNVRVSLFPLLPDEKQCQSQDANVLEWCQEINASDAAEALRKIAQVGR